MDCLNMTELNNVSNLPPSLQELLKKIIQNEGYVKCTMKNRLLSTDGNFLGSLYEVDIVGETANGAKETPLLVKLSVTLEKIFLTSMPDVFSREIFIYHDLSKVFMTLQDAAKIPDMEKFKVVKGYESNTEAIIMENLNKKGFKTYHRTQVAPLKFAELSVISIAKFHALSFVVRDKLPKYFEEKIKCIKSPLYLDSEWRCFVHNLCASAAKVLEGEAKSKIEKYAPRFCHLFKKYMQDVVSPNACVCHGDYKLLNILVKEVNGEPFEVYPIDFQLMYFGNPVQDFLHFTFTCSDREFRRKLLNYLKELYFETFANFLRYFDMDVESTYPRVDFEKDYNERFELGLVYGLYMAAFTFAHVDEGFDVRKCSLSELPVIPDEMFEERVKGIVEDYIEWGYL